MKQIKIFESNDDAYQLEGKVNKFLKDNQDKIDNVRINYVVVKPSIYSCYSVLVEYVVND